MEKFTPQRHAFTLVELIVVVTIIAILWTIGFVAYSGYMVTARDSNRVSQLTKISDALQVYSTTKSLPLPENSVTITASGATIAYQWDLGAAVLQTIDYSTNARDPKDDTPFTYFLSADRTNFQLLAFMEEQSSLQSFLPSLTQGYASLYQDRYPKTYGRRLWVLTDENNTPLQNLTLTNNTLDVNDVGTLTLKSFLSNTEYVVDNLATLSQLQELVRQKWRFWSVVDNAFVYTGTEELAGWTTTPPTTNVTPSTPPPPSRYPGCDTDDITLWSYTIAACNVGATIAWTWSTSNTNNTFNQQNVYWHYFQWWRNKGFAYGDASQQSTQILWSIWLNATPDNFFWFVWGSSLTNGDWATTEIPNTNNWWGTLWGTASRQWPCASWYRVPTQADWQGIVTAGGWGIWFWSNWTAMQSALKLPYAGYRSWYFGTWLNSGSFGHYWSSTPDGTGAYNLSFNTAHNTTTTGFNHRHRAQGVSVRCFKN